MNWIEFINEEKKKDYFIALKKKELDAFDARNAAEVHRMKSEAQKNEKESLLFEYQAEDIIFITELPEGEKS